MTEQTVAMYFAPTCPWAVYSTPTRATPIMCRKAYLPTPPALRSTRRGAATASGPHAPARTFLIQHFRHGIETCFRGLAARFPKKIHATSAAGFALKIGLFVFVPALDRFGL